MSLNGYSLAHDVARLDERVDRLETHVSNIEIEHNHSRSTLDEVRSDVKELRKLAEGARGAAVALGIVWTVATFIIALLMRR